MFGWQEQSTGGVINCGKQEQEKPTGLTTGQQIAYQVKQTPLDLPTLQQPSCVCFCL